MKGFAPRIVCLLLVCVFRSANGQTNDTFTDAPLTAAPTLTPAAGHTDKSVATALATFLPSPAAQGVYGAVTGFTMVCAVAINPPFFAGRKAVVQAAVSIVNCELGPESYDPSVWIASIPVSMGDSTTRWLQGSLMETLVLVLLVILPAAVSTQCAHRALKRGVGKFSAAMTVYFLANAAFLASSLVVHGVGGRDTGLGFLGLVVIFFVCAWWFILIQVLVPRHVKDINDLVDPDSSVPRKWIDVFAVIGDYFTTADRKHTHCFTVELLIAVAAQIVSGTQSGSCRVLGVMCSVLAALRVAYLAVLRPYWNRLTNLLAVILGASELLLAVVACLSVGNANLLVPVGLAALANLMAQVLFGLLVIHGVLTGGRLPAPAQPELRSGPSPPTPAEPLSRVLVDVGLLRPVASSPPEPFVGTTQHHADDDDDNADYDAPRPPSYDDPYRRRSHSALRENRSGALGSRLKPTVTKKASAAATVELLGFSFPFVFHEAEKDHRPPPSRGRFHYPDDAD